MRPPIEARPEGLYCPAGDFYVDPLAPVPRAVLSHAHSDHARPGHAEVHCAADGVELMHWRLGDQALVAHGHGEEFVLGKARLSLHPAGHMLGSAQLAIEVDGRRWIVSGDYKRQPDPTCAPWQALRCDGFLTEATFALPIYRWPPTAEVIEDLLDWWRHCQSRGQAALLLCYALGKAQRLLAELAALPPERLPASQAYLHGAMLEPTERYRRAGVRLLDTVPVMEQSRRGDFAGQLVLAPPSAQNSPWLRRLGPRSTAFASGWMRLRGNRRRRGVDRGFVVSDHADWPALLQTIAESGATQVLATHGDSHALVRLLRERGLQADELPAPGRGLRDAADTEPAGDIP